MTDKTPGDDNAGIDYPDGPTREYTAPVTQDETAPQSPNETQPTEDYRAPQSAPPVAPVADQRAEQAPHVQQAPPAPAHAQQGTPGSYYAAPTSQNATQTPSTYASQYGAQYPAPTYPAPSASYPQTPGSAGAPGTAGQAGVFGQYGTAGTAGTGQPTPPPARRGRVGLIAALAVGALVGGVSGGIVTASMINSNDSSQVAGSAIPANITVNDPQNATIVTAVAAKAGPSVVTISVADSTSSSAGTGSGVFVSADGYIVTNTHVVTLDGASASPTISVQTSAGRLLKATLIGTDPVSDLAVIKVDGSGFPAMTFADSTKLNVGDTAVAIGAPLGLSNTVTNGIVSSLNRSITVASSAAPGTTGEEAPDPNGGTGPFDFWEFGTTPDQQSSAPSSSIALSVIQTDAAINPGNSGGALLNSDGELIGLNVAIASAGSGSSGSASGNIGVGFAIPSNLVERISKEIIATGSGSHGLLGAAVSDVTASVANVVGARIETVENGGAADAGGLQVGDIVTSINGLPVTDKTDLTAQVRALAPGAKATIGYQRGTGNGQAEVTLGTLG